MNPNIEVITPELWAVNSSYIKAGWIQDLTPISGIESTNEYASLTNDGIMILKKESEFYPILKQFVPKVMQYTDKKLLCCIQALKFRTTQSSYEKVYLNVMEWEIKRRFVRDTYLNNRPCPTWKIRIKKFLQKVGEIYGNYKNSD